MNNADELVDRNVMTRKTVDSVLDAKAVIGETTNRFISVGHFALPTAYLGVGTNCKFLRADDIKDVPGMSDKGYPVAALAETSSPKTVVNSPFITGQFLDMRDVMEATGKQYVGDKEMEVAQLPARRKWRRWYVT